MSRLSRTVVLAATAAAAIAAAVHLNSSRGFTCQDFKNPHWHGPATMRIERDIASPLLGNRFQTVAEQFSTVCAGWLYVDVSDRTTFVLLSDDASDFAIDRQTIVSNLGQHGIEAASGSAVLMAGSHEIQVRHAQYGGDASFSLLAARGSDPLQPLRNHMISTRPLGRVEYHLRPFAPIGSLLILLAAAALIASTWRDTLRSWSRVATSVAQRVHRTLAGSPRRALVVLLITSIASRVALTPITHAILWPDSDLYYYDALNMLQGNWSSREIFRTPLYPMFMSMLLAADSSARAGLVLIALQRVMGITTTILLYRIGAAAVSQSAAFYAALLWTVSPLQLYYETAVTTETLFVFLIAATIFATLRLWQTQTVRLAAAMGMLCAGATLTRPVAKGIIALLIAGIAVRAPRRALVLAPIALAAYSACVLPVVWDNKNSYGFFGISRGEGLGLFMRAFDVERLIPPTETRYADVHSTYQQIHGLEHAAHYRVRAILNSQYGYSSAAADQAMAGFALETIARHPFQFAGGIVADWVQLLISPHRSLGLCRSLAGPVLCAERNTKASHAPFPNQPRNGFEPLKHVVAYYMRTAYWVIPLLAPVAIGGIVLVLVSRRERSFNRVVCAVTVIYFTVVSVAFNTIEDRYRLPIDGFILLFVMVAIERVRATRVAVTRASSV